VLDVDVVHLPDGDPGRSDATLFEHPGRLLDVLSEAGTSLSDNPQLVHYLAVPPSLFGQISTQLAGVGLCSRSTGWTCTATRWPAIA